MNRPYWPEYINPRTRLRYKFPCEVRQSKALSALFRASGLDPNARAQGLFATRDIPAATPLGYYTGHIIFTEDEMDEVTGYELMIEDRPPWIPKRAWARGRIISNRTGQRGLVVDASSEGNALRFVNSYLSPSRGRGEFKQYRQNVEILSDGTFSTTQPIPKGSELFVDYGNNYWRLGRKALLMDSWF
jgi:hypothetical protein